MEQHVTNLEISKKLKELGVKQESQFYWCYEWDDVESQQWIEHNEAEDNIICSAFLASELGERLPSDIKTGNSHISYYQDDRKGFTKWEISYTPEREDRVIAVVSDNSLPNAMGKMLIYLLESGLLKPEGEEK